MTIAIDFLLQIDVMSDFYDIATKNDQVTYYQYNMADKRLLNESLFYKLSSTKYNKQTFINNKSVLSNACYMGDA